MGTIMNLADIMKHENIRDERHDIFLKQQTCEAIFLKLISTLSHIITNEKTDKNTRIVYREKGGTTITKITIKKFYTILIHGGGVAYNEV